MGGFACGAERSVNCAHAGSVATRIGEALGCKNHRSTDEFSSSRGHSSVPTRIDHVCRVRVRPCASWTRMPR